MNLFEYFEQSGEFAHVHKRTDGSVRIYQPVYTSTGHVVAIYETDTDLSFVRRINKSWYS